MQESFKARLASYGQWTYRGAWALEASAAAMGLITGIALGYQAFASSEAGSVTSIDLILASAPFIMVAIAELTKIPIATLLFSASWVWKPIVLIFLVGLAGITFETVFMGLERAAKLRQLRYEELVNRIKKNEFERDLIVTRITDAASQDALKDARQNIDQIVQQSDRDRLAIENQIKSVEKDMEGKKIISPAAARARESIAAKAAERDRILTRRDGEMTAAIREFESQRESFVDRIKSARISGDNESARRYEGQLDRLQNPRRRIEIQYQPQIASLETEISTLSSDFDKAQSAAAPMSASELKQLETRRDELRLRAEEASRDWYAKLGGARELLDKAQFSDSEKRNIISGEQNRKDELSLALTELETRRIEFARTDQIRRIAARFYGSRPESVSDDQAGFVSVVWFGSLALLAALAGPLTAIVALSLQRVGEPASQTTKLWNTLRRMFLSWRWRRVRTIKMPYEVFVEKEIEKRVEVPVERVIKEILYVPVLTDDPDAVRRALNDTLPTDVANLVRATFNGRRHGS